MAWLLQLEMRYYALPARLLASLACAAHEFDRRDQCSLPLSRVPDGETEQSLVGHAVVIRAFEPLS
jgi:hypothetical protein